MIKLFEKLLRLIYVRSCFYCKSTKEDSDLCSNCRKKIHFKPHVLTKLINDCKVFSCTIYDDVIEKMIKDLKYKGKKNLAKLHAQIMYDYFKKLNLNNNFLVISVPIHKNRKRERTYNHMDLVAKEFSKLSGFKSNTNFLLRIKNTKKQFNLHKNERIKNLKDAFTINSYENVDKNADLLIIDDITATGATLNELIKLLNKNGYKNITALTLASPALKNEQTKSMQDKNIKTS